MSDTHEIEDEWPWWVEQTDKPIEADGCGNILYRIYGQDGTLVDMKCADTRDNRRLVLWIRQHDRYTPSTTEIG